MTDDAKAAVPPDFPSEASSLDELAEQVHKTAVEHGWWESERNVGETMMLMTTEISEAFEHWRNGKHLDEIFWDAAGKPDGVAVELADCVIRVLDFCRHHRVPLARAMLLKMWHNEGRPYRHGGKRA